MKDKNIEKEKNSGSPIFILIIFASLLVFIFYVPNIYKKYNSNLAEIFGIGTDNKEEIKEIQDDKDPTSEYFQIGSLGTLKFNEITINNISLNNNILSFDILINGDNKLDDLNYYLEFFESKVTFIGRRTLSGNINNKGQLDIDVNGLDVNTSTYFIVSHIDDGSIPKEVFNVDESGIVSFTCSKDDISYTYDFYLDELIKVIKKVTYTNNDLSLYSNELLKYQKLVKEYDELNGVTSIIAENNNTFIYTLELDYSNIQVFTSVKDDYKYKKGTRDNVIKFKMDAKGFECS